ncbi:DUF1887 family CARF protein [Thalassotalea ponticola]|uniref:Card1-like endonuclease domain-containing protein n=1 Tax=Thalassotalea ponticola TaxID=1523392 RepID=UPI0025B36C65|nr:DUF1887 family CARF protein [Thalassotalea ponticola]MDN3652754.1 DUF1887 family CARF protein [Thalassotalea ponticola]
MKTCHISLLDEQHTNALTPLLDPAIPSTRTVFLITTDQKRHIENLKALLEPRGIQVSYHVLPERLSTGGMIDEITEIFSGELNKNEDEQVVFNATCGSRRLALITYDIARTLEIESYIIESDLDALYWLYPEEKPNSELADKIKLIDYFKVHDIHVGMVSNIRGVLPKIRELGKKWTSSAVRYSAALGMLNYLASSADNGELKSEPMNNSMMCNSSLQDLLDDLEYIGFVERSGKSLIFSSEETRFFANGGWLEEYVFGTIVKLKKELPRLQDCAQGMEVIRKVGANKVQNELDVVCLKNNKLHIIECKTKKFLGGEGNEVIYKLDSISDLLGGSHSRALFVSLKKIRFAEDLRAKELDITFMGPEQLPNLEGHLRNWLRQA